MDQFEDYEEGNSVLSHETETDVFFYPNHNHNNSILSESSKNRDIENLNNIVPKSNLMRSPSPLMKNPFDDHFLDTLNKPNDFLVINRKAVLKKENVLDSMLNELQKPEKLSSFKDNSMSKLSSNTNFYEQEKLEAIFPNDSLQVR